MISFLHSDSTKVILMAANDEKSWLFGHFGGSLVTKDGTKSTMEVLGSKKLIGIYFSAHWCPPCRQFTPMLVEFYKLAKEADPDDLEIVFISSDRDVPAFEEYYATMPFAALEFEDREVKAMLAEKYGVRGIPSFIVLDASGAVKDASARSAVMANVRTPKTALATWSK